MNVGELINYLQQFPITHSHYLLYKQLVCLLESGLIETDELCYKIPDSWVHAKRPDKDSQENELVKSDLHDLKQKVSGIIHMTTYFEHLDKRL
jgi:hypothetical protein